MSPGTAGGQGDPAVARVLDALKLHSPLGFAYYFPATTAPGVWASGGRSLQSRLAEVVCRSIAWLSQVPLRDPFMVLGLSSSSQLPRSGYPPRTMELVGLLVELVVVCCATGGRDGVVFALRKAIELMADEPTSAPAPAFTSSVPVQTRLSPALAWLLAALTPLTKVQLCSVIVSQLPRPSSLRRAAK
jgi:hypothetical protein